MKVLRSCLIGLTLASAGSAFAEPTNYTCTFLNGTCTSRIAVCGATDSRDCKGRMVVECSGATGYDSEFVVRVTEANTLFQGVTSQQTPTPPAITVQPGDLVSTPSASGGHDRLDAHLFAAWGVASGSCRVAQ